MHRDAAQAILENISVILEPDTNQRQKVEELLHSQGFQILLGVLQGEKHGRLQQLRNFVYSSGLSDQGNAQRLGVIQGHIDGIERLREVVLECVTVPTEAKETK